ncbi:MAG TPA: hypothetical protein VFQ27_01290 [Xanthobacteraceae bacterium]|nr:hypothetical protein [Xanthobacteraceae bacterium]
MRSFLAACVAAVIIALIAAFVLERVQEPASRAFATSSVRI